MKAPTLAGFFVAVGMIFSAAAAPRIYVSTEGNDTNPGTVEEPKRTFAVALDATDPGGEVVVKDSGSFGNVRVNKTVSIIAPAGVYAGVRSATGITVDAPTATVVLRGLTVQGEGNAGSGISIVSATAVHVENCVINGFNEGISQTTVARLFVKDSALRSNVFAAIHMRGGRASFDRVRLEGGGHGLITEFAGATLSNSVITGNGGTGVLVLDGSVVTVEACQVTDSQQDGLNVTGLNEPALLRFSNSTVTDNIFGGVVAGQGGTLESRGNNTVRGNGTDVIGVLLNSPGI